MKITEVYMKKLAVLIISLFLVLTGCNVTQETKNNKLNIVCTVFPQYDFVREIAKDRVNLSILLPPGSEAHSYEPSADNIIALNNADLFIGIGGESEHWAERLLDGVKNDGLKTIFLIDSVDRVTEEITEGMEKASHSHEKGHEHNFDEHIWTSIENAIIMCDIICQSLCEIDPENSEFYENNNSLYKDKLNKLQSKYEDILEDAKRNTIVFGDRFPMRYLTESLGLNYFAAFPGCSSKTEPSAKTIAYLSDKVLSENIPVVFYMDYSDGRIAKSIAKQSGAKIVRLYSCHNLSKKDYESGQSYLSLMTKNASSLREALR